MRLVAERKRRGWSQAELARRAWLNPNTISLIETGRLRPYPSQLRKICTALGWPESEAERLLAAGAPVINPVESPAKSALRTGDGA
jgi:transcriptional regulator with XRE-family HTH domain